MSGETQIRILPIQVANKIAAGEVVDRPASVVKELLENAIDAGATRIDVNVAAGGRKLVSVRDNGAGMIHDDALLSVERQATSKIRDVDDIENIGTLGFRGEALAAIASVSRFRMLTCRRGETAGTEILISGGKIQDVSDAGCPEGTSIDVRDLFFNVPARRKFLRTQHTELSHVRSCFITQALAHPEIAMSLAVDGRETYRLAGGSDHIERIRELFGGEYMAHLREISHKANGIDVSGYVSVPTFNRADRNEQYVYVNGRAATAPLINYAIKEGYHAMIADRRHASVFIFLVMDTRQVDVNVHPAKKEVRFRRPSDVRDALIIAIQSALKVEGEGDKARLGMAASRMPVPGEERQLTIRNLPVAEPFSYPKTAAATQDGKSEQNVFSGAGEGAVKDEDGASPWSFCRVLGQVGGLYVILETEDGYVVMDPHAAHERVLFERYLRAVKESKVETQNLLMPETVKLGPRDAEKVRGQVNVLSEMGFSIADFGGDTFVVDAVPGMFSGASAKALLIEVARHLEEAGTRGGKGRWREEAIAQAACKASVRARDNLALAEIEKLVVDLAGCEMPYTCPHGRPTLIYTSYRDLRKQFGRE